MPITATPWMGSVTLTLASTAYQLQTLLDGLADAVKPVVPSRGPLLCQAIAIQADPLGGGAIFYLGNAGLTTAHYGVRLLAGQSFAIYSMESNLIRLDHIYALADTASLRLNVVFVTR